MRNSLLKNSVTKLKWTSPRMSKITKLTQEKNKKYEYSFTK